MAFGQVKLRNFSSGEIFFTDQQTRAALTFIFPNETHSIRTMTITNDVKGFAQGLILAAIDSSYDMGWAQILWSSTATPGAGVKDILKEFAKGAYQHWFEHATAQELQDIKIYESVRRTLQLNFKSQMAMIISGCAYMKSHIHNVAFA